MSAETDWTNEFSYSMASECEALKEHLAAKQEEVKNLKVLLAAWLSTAEDLETAIKTTQENFATFREKTREALK